MHNPMYRFSIPSMYNIDCKCLATDNERIIEEKIPDDSPLKGC
jgi:hypothetical protein